jgi:hypothetical protein
MAVSLRDWLSDIAIPSLHEASLRGVGRNTITLVTASVEDSKDADGRSMVFRVYVGSGQLQTFRSVTL